LRELRDNRRVVRVCREVIVPVRQIAFVDFAEYYTVGSVPSNNVFIPRENAVFTVVEFSCAKTLSAEQCRIEVYIRNFQKIFHIFYFFLLKFSSFYVKVRTGGEIL